MNHLNELIHYYKPSELNSWTNLFATANWDKTKMLNVSFIIILSAHISFSALSILVALDQISAHPPVTHMIHVDIPLLLKGTGQPITGRHGCGSNVLPRGSRRRLFPDASIGVFPPWNVMDIRDLKTSRSLSGSGFCVGQKKANIRPGHPADPVDGWMKVCLRGMIWLWGLGQVSKCHRPFYLETMRICHSCSYMKPSSFPRVILSPISFLKEC